MALDGLSETMRTVQNLLGDETERPAAAVAARDAQFIQESRETLAVARTTLESFQQVSEKAHVNLENLEQFTGPLGSAPTNCTRRSSGVPSSCGGP
jgi:hypothetical protein